MSGYLLAPVAESDMLEIWEYIAQDSEPAAQKVVEAVLDACEFLADGPLRGHTRTDLTREPIRFWTLTRYPNFTVIYLPETDPLMIVGVLHGRRNIKRILRERF